MDMRKVESQDLTECDLFAVDIVLLADTKEKLQQAIVEWQGELRKVLIVFRAEETDMHFYCNAEEH